jgi:hypothetical protein
MWEVERMKPARSIVLADRTVEEIRARRVGVSRATMRAGAPPPAGKRNAALGKDAPASLREHASRPANTSMPT